MNTIHKYKDIIFHGEKIGTLIPIKQCIRLNRYGQRIFYEYIVNRFGLTKDNLEQEVPAIKKLFNAKEFLKEYFPEFKGSQAEIRTDDSGRNPICIEGILSFLNKEYDYPPSTRTRGLRTIRTMNMNGEVGRNTYYKKALKLVERGVATWVDKETIKFPFKARPDIDEKGVFFKLFGKQDGKCAICQVAGCEEDLELHHKWIPQCVRRIDKLWNVELLCSKCHLKQHSEATLVHAITYIYSFPRKIRYRMRAIKFSVYRKLRKALPKWKR